MQTLGASLIVKNEELRLEDCLKSIQGVDEIVILDTGSTDRTGEIARKYTDKYIEGVYEWNDHFAEARNKALEYNTTDWLLLLDADERLLPGAMEKIREAIENAPKDLEAFACVMVGQNEEFYSFRVVRNLAHLRFNGRVHEYMIILNAIERPDIRIEFNKSANRTPDRNLKLLERSLMEDPNDLRSIYMIAREYFIYQYYPNAIYWFEKYLRITPILVGPEYADVCFTLAWCYCKMGDIGMARKHCMEAIMVNPDFKEAFEMMGEIAGESLDAIGKERWNEFASTAQNRGLMFLSKGEKS